MIEHDHTKALEVCQDMAQAAEAMKKHARDCGRSHALKDLSKKYQHHLLAKHVLLTPSRDGQNKPIPVVMREYMAMATPEYHAEFKVLEEGLMEAHAIIKEWDADEKLWESSRSILSFSKRIKVGLDG